MTAQENEAVADAEAALDEGLKLADAFMAGTWAGWVEKLSQVTLSGDAVVLK
jgi:hypothetical protein